MGQESFLLRMLEPAVRPDATSGALAGLQRRSGAADPSAPIETRSFEDLLAEVQMTESQAGSQDVGEGLSPSPAASPLAHLAQFNQIENDSLRRVLAQAQVLASADSQAMA